MEASDEKASIILFFMATAPKDATAFIHPILNVKEGPKASSAQQFSWLRRLCSTLPGDGAEAAKKKGKATSERVPFSFEPPVSHRRNATSLWWL